MFIDVEGMSPLAAIVFRLFVYAKHVAGLIKMMLLVIMSVPEVM